MTDHQTSARGFRRKGSCLRRRSRARSGSLPHAQKGKRLRHDGWSSIKGGGQKAFDQSSPALAAQGQQAATDCTTCHRPKSKEQAAASVHGQPIAAAASATQGPSTQAVRKGPAGLRTLSRSRACGSGKTAMQFNHDTTAKDAAMPAAAAATRTGRAASATSKNVLQLASPSPTLRQIGVVATRARTNGQCSGRGRAVGASPTFQGLRQIQVWRPHRAHAVDQRARAPQEQVRALPHQGARRGQAQPGGEPSATPRTTSTATGSRRSARAAPARPQPSGRHKFTPNNLNHGAPTPSSSSRPSTRRLT